MPTTRSSTRKRSASPAPPPTTPKPTRAKKQKPASEKPAKPAKIKKAQPPGSSKPAPEEQKTEDTHSNGDERNFWLLKAEPETRIEKGKDVKFSIDDLAALSEPAGWDGVRNYGARNNLCAMKKGDLAFFYHSNCKTPGIVGIIEIVREASVDETAFDPSEPYYDPKSDPANPKWYLVHVEFRRKFRRLIGLQELKKYKDAELSEMPLLKMGRLSVSSVPRGCWEFIERLEKMEEA